MDIVKYIAILHAMKTADMPTRYPEHHGANGKKLNWLRAAVLGANDGIVSIAGLVIGVAGATDERSVIILTGFAGIAAGALSMAAGEYVSVSSQRDTERALIAQEQHEHTHFPEEELQELAAIYEQRGLQKSTALQVAQELSAHDALRAHLDAEHQLDPDDLTNPLHAAIASAVAFLSGAIIPMLAVVIPPASFRVPVAFVAVVAALVATGTISAHVGGANKIRATVRVVGGGVLAMVVTFIIGRVIGVHV